MSDMIPVENKVCDRKRGWEHSKAFLCIFREMEEVERKLSLVCSFCSKCRKLNVKRDNSISDQTLCKTDSEDG